MNKSEELINAFSESFFFKELTFSELEFYIDANHKVELADLLINLENCVLAIQLKARDENAQTQDSKKETKWLEKRCKDAKSQIKDTIQYIRGNTLEFTSNYGQKVTIDSNVEIVPLVVFVNKMELEYEHILKKHNSDGLDVNCMSFEDYCCMCKILVSPGEIVSYLKWRKEFYLHNGNVDTIISDTKWGVAFIKPQRKEVLITEYLMEMYGDNVVYENKEYLQKFNYFLNALSEHTVQSSENDASVEIIKAFSILYHNEIINFVNKIEDTLKKAKGIEATQISGSLRNIERQSMIVFIASRDGEFFESEFLYEYSNKKSPIDTLVQVIVYWINEIEFRIDFLMYKEVSNGRA